MLGLAGCSEATSSSGAGAGGPDGTASIALASSGAVAPGSTSKPITTAAGIGFTDSKAFALKAGDYLIRWSLTAADASGCVALAALHTKDGRTSVEIANTTVSTAGVDQGTKAIRRLKAGAYLITFATTCSWTAAVFAD